MAARTQYFRAPARINIIGEHTDYNDGWVLPTNTALYTRLAARLRRDRVIAIRSGHYDGAVTIDLDRITGVDRPAWSNYVAGIAAELEQSGIELGGADLEIDGNIPLGSGLSSSASLELVVAEALLALSRRSMDRVEVARLCQRAERRYAGVNCGIMDQYSVACCPPGHALLIDCRSLDAQSVALPEGLSLLVVDSGVRHRLPDSGYNDRAAECASAVDVVSGIDAGVTSLRDLGSGGLARFRQALGETLFRRCRHVVSENERTLDAVAAMREGDCAALGRLVSASHASLRDDFEVSVEAVDKLVAIATGTSGILGARMIGGGFGGCVLAIAESTAVDRALPSVTDRYAAISGALPWTHVAQPAQPVHRIDRS